MQASMYHTGRDLSALESASLRKFERIKTRQETRREPYEALCKAVVDAISLAILATGAAIVHNLWTNVSMIV